MSKRNRSASPSMTNRAMRRALTRADRAANDNARERFLHVSRNGTVVPDDNRTPLPYEPGKVCWSVEFFGASLNFNMSIPEMRDAAEAVDLAMIDIRDEAQRRACARHKIIDIFMADAHLHPDGGRIVAYMAVWLAMRGPQEFMITGGAADYCTYVILPSDDPNAPFTFRFLAGHTLRSGAGSQDRN